MEKVYNFIIKNDFYDGGESEIFVRTFKKKEAAQQSMLEALAFQKESVDFSYEEHGSLEDFDVTLCDGNGNEMTYVVVETELE